MNNKFTLPVILFLTAVLTAVSYSDDLSIDDNFFGEAVATNAQIENTNLMSDMDNIESVGFSGSLKADSSYSMTRNYITGKTNNWSNNTLMTYLDGTVNLDIRLKKGIKAFVDLDILYSPNGALQQHNVSSSYTTNTIYGIQAPVQTNYSFFETNTLGLTFRQLYIDANLNRQVYIRAGKQVMKWGKCYLWNPADLVNIQKKSFFDVNASREGAYGVSAQYSFGTFNLFGYLDANHITLPEDLGFAGKAQFVIGGTEVGLSAWGKKNYHSIYALEFSSRVFQIDLRGEASLAQYDDKTFVKRGDITTIPFPPLTITNYVAYKTNQQWVPKVSLGFTKTFDFLDVKDRISLTGEFYYNSTGYTNNLFNEDAAVGTLMATPGAYSMNYHSMFYAAFFGSVSKFILNDMSYSMNGIFNLIDSSGILSTGISYSPVDRYTLSFTVNGFIGPEKAEYTFGGSGLSADASVSINF